MLEVEGELERRIDRAEDVRKQAFVARRLNRDADRAEPVAEHRDALDEDGHTVEPGERELRREREAVGHRLRPAAELILAREAVAGRVELDSVEPARVVVEEVLRSRALGVEAGPPGRVRPARGADANRHPKGRLGSRSRWPS